MWIGSTKTLHILDWRSVLVSSGMELAYTHLEFHIAVVLAVVAEWEDMVCVYSSDGLANTSPRNLLKTRLAKTRSELFW